MENKNTIKQLVMMMEESGETPSFINGWLMSMIDQVATDSNYSMQQSIDNGVQYYQNKALLDEKMASIQKTCNEASIEELYA